VGGNVLHGILDTGNLIGLGVWNFNGKLILDGHNDLDGIQRIKAQIVGKLGPGGDFGGIDLVKVLNDGNDAIGDLGRVDKGLKISPTSKKTGEPQNHTCRHACPERCEIIPNRQQ